MLSARIPKKSVSPFFLKPILPLVPEVSLPADSKKSGFICMDLKAKAGGAATSATYRKTLVHFDEGTPQEWIDCQKDIKEVWTQNSITTPTDRMAIVKSILRGESLTTFDAALAEEWRQDDGTDAALTLLMLEKALAEVSASISPTELWKARSSG